MSDDLTPLLKFTPSANDPDVLETITVQREPLIAKLVEAALDRDSGARHQLLIGPRGIGKTHIMSLVASRLHGAERDDVVVAWLDEDHWGLRGYGRLVAEIVGFVADRLDDRDLAEAATALRTSDPFGAKAEELLREAVGDRRLVLLVENLDDVFRRIGDDGEARLRAFAENWGQLMIVATTQQLFEGVQRQTSPFYGFFAVEHLDELTTENAIELLRRVADLHKDSRLVEFLATDIARSRVAAMQALAGGHPRIWLLLAGCLSVEAIEKLVPVFLEALDDLTPYYQERLSAISDQQQELVVLLAEAGGALSNRELAERSGISQNQVATMLAKLDARAYLRRAELPEHLATGDRRMSFWELREPLMRLCLDVKQARGKPLRIVVEFLRAWYGTRLLDELLRLPESAKLAAEYAKQAVRLLGDEIDTQDVFDGTPSEVVARADIGLELLPHSLTLRLVKATGLLADGRHEEALQFNRALLAEMPEHHVGRIVLGLNVAISQEALDHPTDVAALLSEAEAQHRQRPEDPVVNVLLGYVYERAGRLEDAVTHWAQGTDSDRMASDASISMANALVALERPEDAAAAFAKAARLNPDREVRLLARQAEQLLKLGRFDEARSVLERARKLDPTDPLTGSWLAFTLTRLQRADEAVELMATLVKGAPDFSSMHGMHGLALQAADRHEDALAAIVRASELAPLDPKPQRSRGDSLVALRRYEEAIDAYERSRELGDHSVGLQLRLAYLYRTLDRLEDAARAADEAVRIDGSSVQARFAAAEISLMRDLPESALDLLRQALEAWRESGAHGDPGDTSLLARTLWILWRKPVTRADRRDLIDDVVQLYREFDALAALGGGIVDTVSGFVDDGVSQDEAEGWVEDWAATDAAPELEVALRVMRAAVAWKRDRDRAHLLALPAEQRDILVALIDNA